MNDDMKVLGLHAEWAVFQGYTMWRDFIWANV